MAEPHRTILVVDDNPDLLELLREGLSGHFIILLARNGAEGLTAVAEARPDCAIIDIRMPTSTGCNSCVHCAAILRHAICRSSS